MHLVSSLLNSDFKTTHGHDSEIYGREGGEDYIPNVAIGIRNNALIGIDQVCANPPKRRKTPVRFITRHNTQSAQ